LKNLNSVSAEASGAGEDLSGLKHDIHWLKYELKKLK
jgi:hypothetical protein